LQEAAYGLRHYLSRIELDPNRLTEMERRIAEGHEMTRKFEQRRMSCPALLAEKQSAWMN